MLYLSKKDRELQERIDSKVMVAKLRSRQRKRQAELREQERERRRFKPNENSYCFRNPCVCGADCIPTDDWEFSDRIEE